MTLTEIRAALSSRGLRPLKQLGQNFLHDANLANWLADRIMEERLSEDALVEIGPGLGALTGCLLTRGARVIALEKDKGLCAFLRDRFAQEIAAGQLDLRHGDALEFIPNLPAHEVCGNLPYYISTPLLMECLRAGAPRLLFVVQREVGERLASAPGTKAYGALSVLVQVGYGVELLRILPGSVFYPAPEVGSIAVRLRRKDQTSIQPGEAELFRAFVQRGFAQRRKKLSNLLPTRDSRRAEELDPAQWVELWRNCAPRENGEGDELVVPIS